MRSMSEIKPIASVEAVWLDYDFVSITFSVNKGEIESMLSDSEDNQLLSTLLGEAALQALKIASNGN